MIFEMVKSQEKENRINVKDSCLRKAWKLNFLQEVQLPIKIRSVNEKEILQYFQNA